MDPRELIDIDIIVDLINQKVNIPFLSEDQEKVLIKAVIMLIIHAFPKKSQM